MLLSKSLTMRMLTHGCLICCRSFLGREMLGIPLISPSGVSSWMFVSPSSSSSSREIVYDISSKYKCLLLGAAKASLKDLILGSSVGVSDVGIKLLRGTFTKGGEEIVMELASELISLKILFQFQCLIPAKMLLELTTLFEESSIEKSIWNVLVSGNKRDYEVDLDSRLGKTQVVTPIAPLSQQAGYYCSVCECVVKDSANYLDHINGKKHQRALGMSMRVERASLEQVQERFELLKKRKDTGPFTEQDFDDRILKQQQEEEERKRQRRERKKEKKKEKAAEEETEVDADVAAMMGFGGFGSSKK
ncbi:Zinc finger matrin-type protein 2 [Camellia lanceoleosa]|uniref:Zinc finger matrin-type protein 2 n=1 Tax=Camellia lanceoleosa TaxID=1840588 RepID=A0ACC0IEL6_9ERIC|nr:Zinc finger matrin-type protein 2 [Camellia lanceoleosa]